MRKLENARTKSDWDRGGITERAGRLLQDRSHAAGALAAFVELLEKIEAVQRQRQEVTARVARQTPPSVKFPPIIPVLGRAAAAMPQFWANREDTAGLVNQLGPAVARLSEGARWQGQSQVFGGTARLHNVALVQLAQPVDLAGLSIAEVLESPRFARQWSDAFALRIDGDSMAPMFCQNDLVIVSPKAVARGGQPAVIQVANQVGVTCKVYRRSRGAVRLIPVNPAYPTTTHAASQVVWALRVLARVRVG